MTFRELINEVLIRLREETITADWTGDINNAVTLTGYQKVVGSLINDSKRSVESYHDWLNLRETVSITTVDGQKNYNLLSGQEIKVIDVVNQSKGNNLVQVSRQYMNSVKYPTEASGDPQYYAFSGSDTSNNLKVDLTPIPNEENIISFDLVKYQDELKSATTVMKVPTNPVVLGAWARAISERGEDGGTQSGIVGMEMKESLNQAIILDSGNTQYETDWFVK